MSHFVNCDSVRILDLEAIAAAGASLGYTLAVGQQSYRGWAWSDGRREMQTCEHALVPADDHAGDYEIGLMKAPDGIGWQLGWDSYGVGGTSLAERCGEKMGKLLQAYSVQVVQRTAARTGSQVVSQSIGANGRIVMRLAVAG